MKRLFEAVVVSFCLAALAACGSGARTVVPAESASALHPTGVYGGIGPGSMEVLLGDAAPQLPGINLAKLNLGVDEIDGIANGQTTVLAKYSTPYVVNVLNEPGNNGAPVAAASNVRTSYQALRLIVDNNTSGGVDSRGNALPLYVFLNSQTMSSSGAGANTVAASASSSSTSITVTQPFSLPSVGAVRVDFNAFESLGTDGYGDLLTQFALFVAPYDTIGSISGHVVDSSTGLPVKNAVVAAIGANGAVGNTGTTDAYGNFALYTLNAGSYRLTVYNDYVNAAGWETVSNSSSYADSIAGPSALVIPGRTSNVGTIHD